MPSSKRLNFTLEAQASGSKARAARLKTLHNEVVTPVFMPVATQAALRGQQTTTVHDLGAQVLLANTYHLYLRPGTEVFKSVGGIHKFMNWDRSVLTDSGGFQIFSLSHLLKMSEQGAEFRSYVDGKKVLLTPELSIETQRAIGSDIMMVLDQCISSTSAHEEAVLALGVTERWAKRSLAARGDSPQSMFGIVQGACYPDLRKTSASQITALPFDGFALGGLAVGEGRAEREDTTELTAELLPSDLPRYLMGVGTPIDLLEAVHRGVDMFDCILPTSLAQQGVCFTSHGKIDLRRGVYRLSEEKLDPDCPCETCRLYSRAYLHHLIKCGEFLGGQLLSTHNLSFYMRLMSEMRSHILQGTFLEFYGKQREPLAMVDPEFPTIQPKRKGKKIPESLGKFEIVDQLAGFSSIKDSSSGEIMHSVSAPSEEAEVLYVHQSRIAERLLEEELEPLVIWDVGLGAGSNAMALISRIEELATSNPKMRSVRLVSFELDLDALRLTLLHPWRFSHIRHQAPHKVLATNTWTSETCALEWTLLEGDYLQRMVEAPAPDIVFYDPFSLNTDTRLWSLQSFERLFNCCKGKFCELFTYSASTSVRASLMGAGFFVAKGTGIGPKSSTTIGLSTLMGNTTQKRELLGLDWLSRWERSDSKFPPLLDANDRVAFAERIKSHPQWSLIVSPV